MDLKKMKNMFTWIGGIIVAIIGLFNAFNAKDQMDMEQEIHDLKKEVSELKKGK